MGWSGPIVEARTWIPDIPISWRKRMLVLSRKQFEGIQIGSDIRIKVVKVDRNQVRLGIEAPPDVMIVRDELVSDSEVHEARSAWDLSDPKP